MNKYDKANRLAKEIQESKEYSEYKSAKQKVEHNVDVRNYSDDHNKYIKEGMNKIYFIHGDFL